MKKRYLSYSIFLLVLSMVAVPPVRSQYYVQRFSAGELDQLTGPIALYPDPLLAQVLPASTFIDDINAAADFIASGRDESAIDDQNWDISVRAVAHYPRVLNYMADRPDWTTSLGQAYIYQREDTMDSIQRLRSRASRLGYLFTTPDQEVIVEGSYIRIVPENPEFIYVPTYNPDVVFVRPAPQHDVVLRDIFILGLGIAIGSWLDRDCDWDHHRVYYHGWQGGGWISRSRPHIQINNIYVNNNFRSQPVPVNRGVLSRNISPYRSQLRSNTGKFTPPRTITRRGETVRPTTGVENRKPAVPTNRTNRTVRPSSPTPATGVDNGGRARPTNRTNRTVRPSSPTPATGVDNGGLVRPTNRTNRTVRPSSGAGSGAPTGNSSNTGPGVSKGRQTNRDTSGGSSARGSTSGASGQSRNTSRGNKPASDRSKGAKRGNSTDKNKGGDNSTSSDKGGDRNNR